MSTLSNLLKDPKIAIGATLTLLIVGLALLGPIIAPYGEYQIVGKPFSHEGSFLGTDYLGQDVLSRVMHGGASVLFISLVATIGGVLLGVIAGVSAAYAGGWLDEIVMRLGDVLLAFPQVLLALVVLSVVDSPTWWMIAALVGVAHAPRVARVARGVALTYVTQDFIAAAEAMGESRWRIAVSELGPNLVVPLLAETGLRLTYSIGMVAGIGFLGFSTNPGAADWGQMTSENRLALLVQPWGVLAPVLLIGLFTIGTNLIADGLGERSAKGTS
ncbi:ABC transporter permease [Gephyromycinifex aptenodytis]|uniref:ABC transporter permease n=1 Tax=Gephyromycinifex aptenodytis TaxID=2716227 RepID=UPI001445C941|nr:ABC transporter permease [Gephyromycinifex aptenodytis]